MGKTISIQTPNGSIQHLTREQLDIAGIGQEYIAAGEELVRVARLRAEVGGHQWIGIVAGTAEEVGFLADRGHDTRRALQQWIEEERRPGESAPTRRDIALGKVNFMTKLKVASLSLAGALGAAAGTVGIATAYPKLALGLTVAAAFFGGLAITLPAPKV